MLFLTFQIGDQRLALDVRRVREVVPRVPLQRPPLAPEWLAGMFVYRGAAVPVVDLHRLMRTGDCPAHLSSRIILTARSAESGEALIGLLAAQVVDVRDIDSAAPNGKTRQVTVEAGGIMQIVDLERILPPPDQLAMHVLVGGHA